MASQNDDLGRVGFGTSGVRGLVEDLTDPVCTAYTLAFLAHLRRQGSSSQDIALGHDLRPSSPRIAAACAAAIVRTGHRVAFCGPLPTPALALYAARRSIPAIMITGSHIPFDRNGIKFYGCDGEILKADEQGIRDQLGQLPQGWRGAVAPTTLPIPDAVAVEEYLARYLTGFSGDLLVGWRIGIYQHSGVARDLLVRLLSTLGAETVALERSDSFVPVDTEAVDPALEQRARAWVAQHRLDAVISTDGDADRPLIGDERGEFFRGDVVGILTARHLAAEIVVTPVSSNTATEGCGAFTRVVRTRIGSPYVIEAMREAAASGQSVIGFEANGGVLTQSDLALGAARLAPLPTRDAVLPILCLLAMARGLGGPLSALRATLPTRFTASGRLAELSPERMRALLALIADQTLLPKLLPAVAIRAIDRTDGTRVTLADGRIVHLRPSGNAPELRCYAEAETPALAQELVDSTLARVGQAAP